MNPSSSPSVPSRDLFFRLTDRLQIDACLEAIEQQGKSVILQCMSPGLLDHYSQILVQRLRKRLSETPTEIFFPTHTDALIARFNDLLEDVSVDAATQSQEPQPPRKLWIVHDASALPEHELKLLLRLLQHLPGARVSAVLLLSGQAPALRNLDPQGRRLMRWEIEPPTQAQIDQMVEEARQAGREFAALELIARLETASPAPAREPSLPKFPPAALGALGAAAPGPSSVEAAPAAPAARRSGVRTPAIVIAVLLVLSAGVASWLHPEVLQGLIGSDGRSPAASEAAQAAPAASSPAPASEPASAADIPAAEASAASEPASAATPPASPAQPQASTPSIAASAPASAAAASPVQSASTPRVISELPDSAQNGLVWLRKLEADTWVIEHGRHPTVQAARKQMAADKVLANARIVPIVQPGADTAQFLVVTGPFRSMDRARNYMARNELGRSAAVHDVNTLKTLTPPGPGKPPRP